MLPSLFPISSHLQNLRLSCCSSPLLSSSLHPPSPPTSTTLRQSFLLHCTALLASQSYLIQREQSFTIAHSHTLRVAHLHFARHFNSTARWPPLHWQLPSSKRQLSNTTCSIFTCKVSTPLIEQHSLPVMQSSVFHLETCLLYTIGSLDKLNHTSASCLPSAELNG